MATLELKEHEWQEFSQAEYAVIDCYGQNCSACVMLAPIYDAVADELAGVSFGRIDISVYPEVADKHGINAMPTLLFFRKGELISKATGSMEREELLGLISALLYQ